MYIPQRSDHALTPSQLLEKAVVASAPPLAPTQPSVAGVSEISRLRAKLDRIGEINKNGAGQNDEYAREYHKQVNQPTSDLSSLVDQIGQLFSDTGVNGKAASKGFDNAEDEANHVAGG